MAYKPKFDVEKHKRVYEMYMGGMTFDEIAAQLKLSREVVRKKFHKYEWWLRFQEKWGKSD